MVSAARRARYHWTSCIDGRSYACRNVEWSHWMSSLLKLAPNLVGLQLKLPVYPLPIDVPVMTNLRHLIISVQSLSRLPVLSSP